MPLPLLGKCLTSRPRKTTVHGTATTGSCLGKGEKIDGAMTLAKHGPARLELRGSAALLLLAAGSSETRAERRREHRDGVKREPS